MITIRVGRVSDLAWWRLLHMSDQDIEEFNNKHLTVIEMKDDSLADTQQDGYEMKLSQAEMTKAASRLDYCPRCDRYHNFRVGCSSVGIWENVYEREIWNRAIEAAAEFAEINSAADIRKLKK